MLRDLLPKGANNPAHQKKPDELLSGVKQCLLDQVH